MKVSGFWGLAGAVIGGLILANLVLHPDGVKALAGGANSLLKTTTTGLTGGSVKF
jgi:hypothetical protein